MIEQARFKPYEYYSQINKKLGRINTWVSKPVAQGRMGIGHGLLYLIAGTATVQSVRSNYRRSWWLDMLSCIQFQTQFSKWWKSSISSATRGQCIARPAVTFTVFHCSNPHYTSYLSYLRMEVWIKLACSRNWNWALSYETVHSATLTYANAMQSENSWVRDAEYIQKIQAGDATESATGAQRSIGRRLVWGLRWQMGTLIMAEGHVGRVSGIRGPNIILYIDRLIKLQL